MATQYGAVWTYALTVLDQETPNGAAQANAVDGTGTVVVGLATTSGGPYKASQWSGATLSLLAEIAAGGNSNAFFVSVDGSTILGTKITGTVQYKWTSAGTVAEAFTPATGYTGVVVSYDGTPQGTTSEDGTLVVGSSTGGPISQKATTWDSFGTATLLPSVPAIASNVSNAYACSDDGAIVVGTQTVTGPTTVTAVYWDFGPAACHYLDNIVTASRNYGAAFRCTSDGSIIYGEINNSGSNDPVYWDDIGTETDPGWGFHGTYHLLDFLPAGTFAEVTYCAADGSYPLTTPIAVGNADDATGTWAVRWTGTTAEKLGGLPGGTMSAATACSADGTIVCGYADDATGTRAVYWDAGGTIHALDEYSPGSSAEGFGDSALMISRDGLTIVGYVAAPDIPPATLSMDNVVVQSLATEGPCMAARFSVAPTVGPNIGLEWSDTRGISFGNPVAQIYDPSDYAQLQWNRTGYARDRVFRLFWSMGFKTALNGAFVEVAPLKT